MTLASTAFFADRQVIAWRSLIGYHRYHIVWSTRYRYKVLRGDLRLQMREIIRQVSRENGVGILRGVLSSDRVHMFVSVLPPAMFSTRMLPKDGGRGRGVEQCSRPRVSSTTRVVLQNEAGGQVIRPEPQAPRERDSLLGSQTPSWSARTTGCVSHSSGWFSSDRKLATIPPPGPRESCTCCGKSLAKSSRMRRV